MHPRPSYRRHAPLLTEQGDALLRQMEQHPSAPIWNYTCGDHLIEDDHRQLDQMRLELASTPETTADTLPEAMVETLWAHRQRVPHLAKHLPESRLELAKIWADLPTLSREDLSRHVPEFVPDGVDLERMVVYSTSGTTGHPLTIPNHPIGAASYQLLLERALAIYGVQIPLRPDAMANALVCNQAETIQYAATLSVWNGAGHVKVNLHENGWRQADDARAYLSHFDPPLLTGDPISFAALLDRDLDIQPLALASTAVALSNGLKRKLEARFGCPVFEWISMNEVGPIALACPLGHGHHVLDPGLYVEVLDPEGRPCGLGKRGEVTVTGGRNPMLHLLRYRTGDVASMAFGRCECGSSAPRLVDFEGRQPVVLRSASGGVVNPIDVSRILHPFPIIQHQLVQRADGSVELALRAAPFDTLALRRQLEDLFGGVELAIRFVDALEGAGPGGKVVPFVVEA
ncbi:MAG: hypothetical protein Rubg2KO_37550 [Rubricoccaceae bacterium]